MTLAVGEVGEVVRRSTVGMAFVFMATNRPNRHCTLACDGGTVAPRLEVRFGSWMLIPPTQSALVGAAPALAGARIRKPPQALERMSRKEEDWHVHAAGRGRATTAQNRVVEAVGLLARCARSRARRACARSREEGRAGRPALQRLDDEEGVDQRKDRHVDQGRPERREQGCGQAWRQRTTSDSGAG